MYHGTNSTHWAKIKNEGIKPIGKGTLANGFYFTSSVARASNYFKAYGKKYRKVIIEIIIKNADQLTVGLYNYMNYSHQTNPIMTQTSTSINIWQFIVRDQKIIDKHFQIHRVFIIDD
jgi:hypothetical protein